MATESLLNFLFPFSFRRNNSHFLHGTATYAYRTSALQYSGPSDNGSSLLRKPHHCGQQATVPNYSLYYTVHSYLRIADLSILRVTDTKYRPQTRLSNDHDSPNADNLREASSRHGHEHKPINSIYSHFRDHEN